MFLSVLFTDDFLSMFRFQICKNFVLGNKLSYYVF